MFLVAEISIKKHALSSKENLLYAKFDTNKKILLLPKTVENHTFLDSIHQLKLKSKNLAALK